eukprot:6599384-Prymnesium_polylepis.1
MHVTAHTAVSRVSARIVQDRESQTSKRKSRAALQRRSSAAGGAPMSRGTHTLSLKWAAQAAASAATPGSKLAMASA